MRYKPILKKLHVFVIECNNLKPVDECDPAEAGENGTKGISDPSVKITMFHKKK